MARKQDILVVMVRSLLFLLISGLSLHGTAIPNVAGAWRGIWEVRIGSITNEEPVYFRFTDTGECSYRSESGRVWVTGTYTKESDEIIVQFGGAAADFVALRNIKGSADALSFEAALPTLDSNLQETNLISLSRDVAPAEPIRSRHEHPTLITELLEKHALDLSLPMVVSRISKPDRLPAKAFVAEYVLQSIHRDVNFSKVERNELDVSFSTNRVQVIASGKPGKDSFDLTYNWLLKSNIALACSMIIHSSAMGEIAIQGRGMGAFSMFSPLSLKPKYVLNKTVNIAQLWEDCLNAARNCCSANFDASTLSGDARHQLKISTGLRVIESESPGIVSAERLAISLKPFSNLRDGGYDQVSLGIEYEQFRRRAASRDWQKVQHHRERMLSAKSEFGMSRAELEIDEAVLESIIHNVCADPRP